MNLRRSIGYFFRFGLKTLLRERRVLFQTTLSLGVTFFLIFSMLCFFINLRQSMAGLKQAHEIMVYLDQAISQTEADEKLQSVCDRAEVDGCQYISAQAVEKSFLKRHPQLQAVVNSLEKKPFSPTYRLQIKEIEKNFEALEELVFDLEKIKGVDEVVGGIKEAANWAKAIRILDVFLVFLMCLSLASIMTVIFNAISVLVHARRDEIEILSLVGATDFMLTIPFLVNSMFITLLAFALGAATLSASIYFFHAYLFELLGVDFLTITTLGRLHWVTLLLGSLILSLFGASFAVKRFVK